MKLYRGLCYLALAIRFADLRNPSPCTGIWLRCMEENVVTLTCDANTDDVPDLVFRHTQEQCKTQQSL
jgi:hypothetical protein